MVRRDEFRIRDPFVLPIRAEGAYYLFGSTARSEGCTPDGFDCYRSTDLEHWDGPSPAFVRPDGYWGDRDYWAPEVHPWRGAFYMFATFKRTGGYRGTAVLWAEAPGGPYLPHSDGPVTPPHWECLDGTLHVDAHGEPWIVFCHEWVQVRNGSVCAMRLSENLAHAVDRPVYLFSATDAPWVLPTGKREGFPCYVTDGPFLHRAASGELLMLWSSFGAGGYTLGVARSDDGTVTGRYEQLPEPLWTQDGGHAMLFRTFEGALMLSLHRPNSGARERAVFLPVEEADGGLRVLPAAGE